MKSVQQTSRFHVIVYIIFSSFYREPELGQLWLSVIMVGVAPRETLL
jgi:hypothetical protein